MEESGMMGATFTEQVIVVAGLVIGVALVAFVIGIWYGAGRNAELIGQLEDELSTRRAYGVMPQEIAHEAVTQRTDAERLAEEDQALTIANEDRLGQAWLYTGGRAGWEREPWPAVEPATIAMPAPDLCTDTAWTRAMVAEMDEFVASLGDR
jgi:hypothetical protein